MINIGAGLRNVGHVIAEHPGRTALLAGSAVVAGLVLSGCANSTPPPTPTDSEDQPLLNQLTASRFSNREQSTVLNAIHANNWSHPEAGNMLVQTAPIVGQSDAIDAWRLTKINNRPTAEITGMMQSLDGLTNLSSYQIARVTRDVIATGYSGNDATRFFANAPSWTTTDQDVNAFERLLGLRYNGFDPSGPVIYEPYRPYNVNPQYAPDYYQRDPTFWEPYRPTSSGDGGGTYRPPVNNGGTSPGDGHGSGTSHGDGGGTYHPPVTPPYTPPYTPPSHSGGGTNSGPGNPDFGGGSTYHPPVTPPYTPPYTPPSHSGGGYNSGPGNPGFGGGSTYHPPSNSGGGSTYHPPSHSGGGSNSGPGNPGFGLVAGPQ